MTPTPITAAHAQRLILAASNRMFPNGLRKMRALDHHDEIVAEWVEGEK